MSFPHYNHFILDWLYKYVSNGTTFEWLGTLKHLISKHNAHPSEAFTEMVLNATPNYKPAIPIKELHREGFWAEAPYSACGNLPWPKSQKEDWGAEEFAKKLELFEQTSLVIHESWQGVSTCRLCGCSNGCKEHLYTTPEGICFDWPEGFLHYVRDHNVRPTPKFEKLVDEMTRELTQQPRAQGNIQTKNFQKTNNDLTL